MVLSIVLPIYHAVQTCFAALTGILSFIAIDKLQQYEKPTQRAAQYSNTAQKQLDKTRATQTSGAIAVGSSLISGVILSVPVWSWQFAALLCTANMVGLMLAWQHIRNFWAHKAKIPFATDYDDAINSTLSMTRALLGLAVSWAFVGTVYVLFGSVNTDQPVPVGSS